MANERNTRHNVKILLVDVDSKIPNLALMKISAFHKRKGDEVYLNTILSKPDKVYVSCIFKKNAPKVLGVASLVDCPVEFGGYGINDRKLPDEIEHIMPDYDLYGIDYSMGFTSRGCSRRCEFCEVWRLEGPIRDHAPITEFLLPNHKKVLLLDNNFIMSPRWRENLQVIIDRKLKASICQGFDARLITREIAITIGENQHRFYDENFSNYAIYTAWDRLQDEEQVLRGIQLLLDAGINARYIRPFVLVGYNTTLEEDLYRFNKLRDMGVYPFVMPYNGRGHPLKRWGQRPALYKRVPFIEYKTRRLEELQ